MELFHLQLFVCFSFLFFFCSSLAVLVDLNVYHALSTHPSIPSIHFCVFFIFFLYIFSIHRSSIGFYLQYRPHIHYTCCVNYFRFAYNVIASFGCSLPIAIGVHRGFKASKLLCMSKQIGNCGGGHKY